MSKYNHTINKLNCKDEPVEFFSIVGELFVGLFTESYEVFLFFC